MKRSSLRAIVLLTLLSGHAVVPPAAAGDAMPGSSGHQRHVAADVALLRRTDEAPAFCLREFLNKSGKRLFGAGFDFDPAAKDFFRPEKGLLPREKVFPRS